MFTSYTIAVTCAIVVSAVLMFLIFSRLKLLNFRVLLSIMLASLISAIALPGIFYIISANKNGADEFYTLLLVTVITIAIYIILAFILSMIISHTVPGVGANPDTWKSQISGIISAQVGTEEAVTAEIEMAEAGTVKTEIKTAATDDVNYLEQIFDTMIQDNNKEIANNAEYMPEEENNLEKSVDSIENIDKMGIENKVQESEILTIEECIEEAFRLKEQDDGEGAILYYMYALDKKPHKELTFWIVLDICVIYKALGQYELAYDILNSYDDVFGDIMDVSIRKEIENNLSNI